MLVFSPLNEEAFDVAQVKLGYCKMFKHIYEDFVTRRDMAAILNPVNLPIQATASVTVQVAPPSFTGAGIGPATGNVAPVYKGTLPHPTSNTLLAEKEAERRSGGVSIKAMTEII